MTHICVSNLTIIGSVNGLVPTRNIISWTLRNKRQWNFNPTSSIFIQENAFESVDCEMAAFCLGINVLKGRDDHLHFLHQRRFYSNGFGGANKQSLTFRSLWDVAVILKVHFSNALYTTPACEIAPRWMPQNITYKISSVNSLVLVDPACL